MHRAPDWEARLAAYLDEVRERPFAWGKHDCCITAAGAVLAMTGEDLMAEFRGRYSTKRGSAVALGRYGLGTLEKTMDAKLRRVAPLQAHRGDIAFVGSGLAVVIGRGIAAAVGQEGQRDGLISIGRHEWKHAWAVPF